jgi:hypothetical protein
LMKFSLPSAIDGPYTHVSSHLVSLWRERNLLKWTLHADGKILHVRAVVKFFFILSTNQKHNRQSPASWGRLTRCMLLYVSARATDTMR